MRTIVLLYGNYIRAIFNTNFFLIRACTKLNNPHYVHFYHVYIYIKMYTMYIYQNKKQFNHEKHYYKEDIGRNNWITIKIKYINNVNKTEGLIYKINI